MVSAKTLKTDQTHPEEAWLVIYVVKLNKTLY